MLKLMRVEIDSRIINMLFNLIPTVKVSLITFRPHSVMYTFYHVSITVANSVLTKTFNIIFSILLKSK